MTPDQLRALADALEPMASAPRFEDMNVPELCRWLRAQANAQPVGYATANGLRMLQQDDATVLLYKHDYLIRPDQVPLYTRPAPAYEKTQQELDRLTRELAEARAEIEAFAVENDTLRHQVIACGVAASHPDVNLSRTGAYAGKWNSQQAESVRNLRAERDALAKALTFYATQEHFILSDDTMWDAVSGEPPNWWCDEAGTATVEDGSIARLVLAGGQSAADVIAQIEKEKANGSR